MKSIFIYSAHLKTSVQSKRRLSTAQLRLGLHGEEGALAWTSKELTAVIFFASKMTKKCLGVGYLVGGDWNMSVIFPLVLGIIIPSD